MNNTHVYIFTAMLFQSLFPRCFIIAILTGSLLIWATMLVSECSTKRWILREEEIVTLLSLVDQQVLYLQRLLNFVKIIFLNWYDSL